jgi:hypothetical protein
MMTIGQPTNTHRLAIFGRRIWKIQDLVCRELLIDATWREYGATVGKRSVDGSLVLI